MYIAICVFNENKIRSTVSAENLSSSVDHPNIDLSTAYLLLASLLIIKVLLLLEMEGSSTKSNLFGCKSNIHVYTLEYLLTDNLSSLLSTTKANTLQSFAEHVCVFVLLSVAGS